MNLAGFSGEQVFKILQKHFGFVFTSQKGSHIKLRKFDGNATVTVVVPNHKELATGTLKNILRQAQVDEEDFLKV